MAGAQGLALPNQTIPAKISFKARTNTTRVCLILGDQTMRNSRFWWVFIGFMILLDFYVFQAVKLVTLSASPRVRLIIHAIYWTISGLSVLTLLILPYINFEQQPKLARSTVFAMIIGLFFAKLIASLFFFVDDIRRGALWVAHRFGWFLPPTPTGPISTGMTRSVFLTWTGMAFGGGLFGSLLYGFTNKYRYQLMRVALQFDNLPQAFKGLKVVHISDIHSGSFTDKAAVRKGVEKIKKANPDIILFTGDLVNNTADEMENYIDLFAELQAPMGVYSVLGNHDYGDYVRWDDDAKKVANLEKLKKIHADMGWRLLMNENVILEKDGQSIALLGVENWGAKANFPKYGRLEDAYQGAEGQPFKILMSHDPSHWDAEVRKKYPDIDLTLSGHTHGMQFGVEMPGFRWSPAQYIYDQWAGLYENGKQKLYVNRGYGFLGYPGRVGILPEITVLELS